MWNVYVFNFVSIGLLLLYYGCKTFICYSFLFYLYCSCVSIYRIVLYFDCTLSVLIKIYFPLIKNSKVRLRRLMIITFSDRLKKMLFNCISLISFRSSFAYWYLNLLNNEPNAGLLKLFKAWWYLNYDTKKIEIQKCWLFYFDDSHYFKEIITKIT